MDWQTAFNVSMVLAGFLGGWVLNTIWQSMRELQKADKDLTEKVQAVELLVAGRYVTWDGLQEVLKPISNQLLRIEDKLDRKVDR